MRAIQGAFLATFAAVGLSTAAFAADLPYKVPPQVVRTAWNWSGFYAGVYGGSSFSGNGATSVTGDPTSTNYNTLANNATGVVGVPNAILPGGVNCSGFTNCAGGPAATTITPAFNPGFRNDSLFPTSTTSQQIRGLFGAEIGARAQFDRFVLGIGADFTWFSKDKGTNVTANGTFFNSNGATANSAAVGCINGIVAGTCAVLQNLNTSGSVITTNSGGYAANLAIQSNPDWVGTVRGSVGLALDRMLLTASGGLAYAPGSLKVSGTYTDRTASACSGVSNVYQANTNFGVPGNSFVNYSCNGTPVNSASVNQVVTTTMTYSGNRGGMLTGFAGGFGAAYAITDNIVLTVDSMYYNLGTVTATVTGAGTQTTTTNTTATNVPPGGPTTTTTATVALGGPNIVVSRVIDGYVFRSGVQFKF